MITIGQPVTKTDLDALATLATSKTGNAYTFNAFAGTDKLGLATGLVFVPSTPPGSLLTGRVTFRIYSYKTIAGVKTYSYEFLGNAIALAAPSTVKASWTAPTTNLPDGYIVSTPTSVGLFWKDLGNVTTFTENGTFTGWLHDQALTPDPGNDLPCGHGTWLKTVNTIFKDTLAKLSVFGGGTTFSDTHKVSGPWVVSVAPKCYLTLNGKPALKNIEFIYSEADSTTGNQVAQEADMFGTHVGVDNGANNFNWDVRVKINGRIVIESEPQGQNESDWVTSASHPGITITFDPAYADNDIGPSRICTAFIFDFVDVQYEVGTPVVLTVTPLAGGSVIDAGNPVGTGCLMLAAFTADPVTYPTTDTMAMHAGTATVDALSAKSAALPNTLTPITFTDPVGLAIVLESHHRVFCNGVFKANTLPTLGVMTFLDVDLPNYSPKTSPSPASSRRQLMLNGTAGNPSVTDRAALWPSLVPEDFEPDFTFTPPSPFNGSKAYQALGTGNTSTQEFADTVPPYEPALKLFYYSVIVPANATDLRFIATNPACKIYAKANAFPTPDDYTATAPGGVWVIMADADPGFEKDATWYFAVQNNSSAPVQSTFRVVVISGEQEFFNTTSALDGSVIPQIEGFSYHILDNADDLRPIPQYGYCISRINLRRQPVENAAGVASAPSVGTADLSVDVGVMSAFSFTSSGTFSKIVTAVIPAGSASVNVDLFLPVLKGTPICVKCDEVVVTRAAVNFQPMMHSSFFPKTVKGADGSDVAIGYYDGPLVYNPNQTLLSGTSGSPQLLPVAAAAINDLESLLNVL